MIHGQVVKNKQVARSQRDLDLGSLGIEAERSEEAVRDQAGEKRRLVRPTPLAKKRVEGHQPRDRCDPNRATRNEARCVPRNILIVHRPDWDADVLPLGG